MGGNSIDGNTIAGGIHYVYIAHNSQYSNYVTGDITINIDCGPSPENNNCENATPLTCGSSVEGSTYGANHNELGLVSCMPGYNRRDVFYTLDVLEGMEYTVSVNNENYENALAIYSGICGDLIEIECSTNYLDPSEDNTITFTASANEILIIRTYSYNYYSNYFTIGVSCNNGFDCPDLEANIGDACDDNDENTENDIINEYCDCLGAAIVPPINPFLNLQSLIGFYSYPSPTKGPSKVVFTTHTLLEVYDLNGRNLGTLFNQEAQEGEEYTIDFNGDNLPNGVYIYRMTTKDETIIEKFIIAR